MLKDKCFAHACRFGCFEGYSITFGTTCPFSTSRNICTNLRKRYLEVVLHHKNMPSPNRGSFLFQTFCEDGLKPANPGSKDSGLFVKELLKYCTLDIAAFVFKKGSSPKAQPYRNLTLVTIQKLVCPSNHHHSTMD
jgi:hypothetical protein